MDAAVQPAKENQLAPVIEAPKNPLEQFGWLPCQLSLEVPVTGFTVGDLLRLSKGSIVETAVHYAGDIPLRANGILIGWSEFEAVGNRLAVRLTELA